MMEDEGDNANAARDRNNEVFEAAPLTGANSSWQREGWGRTRQAMERQVRERGERGEGGDSMGGSSAMMMMSTLLPLQSLPPP